MKNTLRFMLILVATNATSVVAQDIHSVPANSKGNTVTLSINNESTLTDAQDVEVVVARHAPGVTFMPGRLLIDRVLKNGATEVIFHFDVHRDVLLNTPDTIGFIIRDGQGQYWEKSIVVLYIPPTTYNLEQNFPNPFNPSTLIRYQLPVNGYVTLKVYDVLGREVTTLVDEIKEAGYYAATFDAVALPSGVYFYRIVAGRYVTMKKLLVMK